MKKNMAVVCLMIFAVLIAFTGSVCAAGDNAEATKKLVGLIKTELAAEQIGEIRSLLDEGADVNAVNPNGSTLMLSASLNGHLEIVRLLIEKGAEINARNKYGFTALYLAASKDYIGIVNLLLSKGAQVDAAANDSFTPLLIASLNGNTETVRILIERGAQVDRETSNGATALYLASLKGYPEIVTLLLNKGAQIDKAERQGYTPLIVACSNGNHEIVKILLRNGAQVNKAMNEGATPLYMASQNAHLEIVRLLLDKGADINAGDKYGFTPIYVADANGHIEIVNFLLSKGAKVDKPLVSADAKALSDDLLNEFFKDHRSEIEKISDDPQRMETYVLSQKDVNVRYKDGKSMLHYAAMKNYPDIVKLLVEKGADINARDKDKRTPLHEAMSYKAFEAVRSLLEKGPDVNLEDNDGKTPLSSIVYWDWEKAAIEVVNRFIEKGFDLHKADRATLIDDAIRRGHRGVAMSLLKNGSPFDDAALVVAAGKGFEDIFNFLLEKGANPNQNGILYAACESGNINIVRTLAVKGNKPSAKDIDICLSYGHKEAAIYLSIILKEENNQQVEIKRRCSLLPSSGSCKARFEGAYYDLQAKGCREFTGCGGVFPFKNLEACKRVCED